MIKDELKKFPPGCIGGKFSTEKLPVNGKLYNHVFYFEEGSLIPIKELNKRLRERGLTFKEWYDYHYLPRDEKGEYIYPKCKYCGENAVWNKTQLYYTCYCENHHHTYVSEIQSKRSREQKIKFGNNKNDLKSFIDRHGDEEGRRRYNKYRRSISRSRTLEGMIENHGDEDGRKLYKKMCDDIRLSHSIEGKIKIHGEEKGMKLHNESVRKRRNSLTKDGFIRRFGFDNGIKRYNRYAGKGIDPIVLSRYINDYGEENAIDKYREDKLREKKGLPSVSKISMNMFDTLYDRLWMIFQGGLNKDIFYGTNEYMIRTGSKLSDTSRRRYPDFLIKSKRIIIEFQGDHWHERPNSMEFKLSDLTDWINSKAENDLHKLIAFRSLGYSVFYAHEHEYRENPDVVIEECIKFITNESFRNEYTKVIDSILNIKYIGPINEERVD